MADDNKATPDTFSADYAPGMKPYAVPIKTAQKLLAEKARSELYKLSAAASWRLSKTAPRSDRPRINRASAREVATRKYQAVDASNPQAWQAQPYPARDAQALARAVARLPAKSEVLKSRQAPPSP